jgi:predicted amidophosphoribosyltransferase
MKDLFIKIHRIFNDLCEDCGGKLNVWDEKRAWCSECGKKD